MMKMSTLMSEPSRMQESKTRSIERAQRIRTWDQNWILIRKLWPNWTPTDEQVRHVWFKSFDKPHGIRGVDRINHEALEIAIIAAAKSDVIWKEPRFLTIADLYRHEQRKTISDLERMRMMNNDEAEKAICKSEHDERVGRISQWSAERLQAAREQVAKIMPTYDCKSGDPSAWSSMYSGLLIAADEKLGGKNG